MVFALDAVSFPSGSQGNLGLGRCECDIVVVGEPEPCNFSPSGEPDQGWVGGATIFLDLLTRVGIGVLLLRFCGRGPAGGPPQVLTSWVSFLSKMESGTTSVHMTRDPLRVTLSFLLDG